MGWNDVRVSLVPPGWTLVSERDSTARTVEGQPVSILRTVPQGADTRSGFDLGRSQAELEQQGFTLSQESESFLRMNRGDIEVFLVAEAGTLSEVILTFTLSRRTPAQLGEWAGLVDHLCQAWGLLLVDRRNQEPVGRQDFLRLLTSSPAWKSFARNWDLPPGSQGLENTLTDLATPS